MDSPRKGLLVNFFIKQPPQFMVNLECVPHHVVCYFREVVLIQTP
jgi:hypothetical protein